MRDPDKREALGVGVGGGGEKTGSICCCSCWFKQKFIHSS